MSILLVASPAPRVGRSLVAAALAYRAARDGRQVTLARLTGDESADHDARVFSEIAELSAPSAPLAAQDLSSLTSDAIVEAPAGPIGALASSLNAKVLVVGTPSASETDAEKDSLAGTIVTSALPQQLETIGKRANVLAVLPEDRILAAPSVADLAAALNARWLHEAETSSIERVMIGTVASDAASPYFANRERTCVVTRYDKTDIQLAALLTDLACLVITGGGEPSPYLIDRVSGRRDEVAIMLTQADTVDTMRVIEPLYGASRFEGDSKLMRAVELLDEAQVPALI